MLVFLYLVICSGIIFFVKLNIPASVCPCGRYFKYCLQTVIELFLFAGDSVCVKLHVRERRFVCDVVNCHQKFISSSAVARHVARMHKLRENSTTGKFMIYGRLCHKANSHGDESTY